MLLWISLPKLRVSDGSDMALHTPEACEILSSIGTGTSPPQCPAFFVLHSIKAALQALDLVLCVSKYRK